MELLGVIARRGDVFGAINDTAAAGQGGARRSTDAARALINCHPLVNDATTIDRARRPDAIRARRPAMSRLS